MTLRIKSNNIEAATLATLSQVKISTITVTDSSFNPLDDLAVDTAGGYLKITGTGFVSGCTVVIGTQTASAVTFVSSTEVRVQIPAQAAGSYILYLVNPDGATAIRVNAVNYSATPTWETASTLEGQAVDTPISIQLSANSATTYTLAAGSTLPAGLILSNVGLLSGTVTGITDDTTYSFTVVATDAELQDSPRTFSVTITAGDEYGMNTVLLLQADGLADGAQNNTFLDSSTNNFSVTRNGNTTQGSFSPYGSRWSNYFDGTGDYFTLSATPTDLLPGTSDTTFECWVQTISSTEMSIFSNFNSSSPFNGVEFGVSNGYQTFWSQGTWFNRGNIIGSAGINDGAWHHLAWVITNSGTTVTTYIDGVQNYTSSITPSTTGNSTQSIGSDSNSTRGRYFNGYIANLRFVKGTAVYTSAFIPPTQPLTAISGTSLLTCQSNRFIDNSTNNFTLTRTGDVRVTKFSPFALSSAYSAETYGGSGYFDGSGDYLDVASNTAFGYGTGDFTIEFWAYFTTISASTPNLIDQRSGISIQQVPTLYLNNGILTLYVSGANRWSGSTLIANTWYHIALCRSSGITRVYLNGTQDGSTYTDSTNYITSPVRVFASNDSNAMVAQSGYISNLRIVKGTALYTTNFTPPTAPLIDISNTSLLLNFTNAGIVDNSTNNTLETIGNAQISTAMKKYGAGSIYFDGTGDYLFSPANINYAMGTGDFTIELWYYPVTTNNTDPNLMGNYNSTWQSGRWAWHAPHATYAGKYSFWVNNYAAGSAILVSTNSIVLNQWVHLTITRSGNTWRMFINGTIESTTTSAVSLDNGTGGDGFWVGANFYTGAGGRYINAYVDDLRITRGIARYTANFTPPGRLPAR